MLYFISLLFKCYYFPPLKCEKTTHEGTVKIERGFYTIAKPLIVPFFYLGKFFT